MGLFGQSREVLDAITALDAKFTQALTDIADRVTRLETDLSENRVSVAVVRGAVDALGEAELVRRIDKAEDEIERLDATDCPVGESSCLWVYQSEEMAGVGDGKTAQRVFSRCEVCNRKETRTKIIRSK